MMAWREHEIAAAIKSIAPVLLWDGAGLAGAALIAYGAWLIYVPAGFIVGGLMLLIAAWLRARAQ